MDALYPWPLEEVVLRLLAVLVLAFVVPIATARVLAAVLVPKGVEPSPSAQARALVPVRRATMFVGAVQVGLAYVIGFDAAGPALQREGSDLSWGVAVGALTVMVVFVAGGIGRRDERARVGADPGRVLDVARLRLRLFAYFLGPFAIVYLLARLPILDASRAPRWWIVALCVALVALATPTVGPLAVLLSGGMRRASPRLLRLAERAASAGGVELRSVRSFPTGTAPFTNAYALPLLRVVVVTSRAEALLDDDELEALLAHECAHLSEPTWFKLARTASLFSVLAMVFFVLAGAAAGDEPTWWLTLEALLVLIPLLLVIRILVRRVARRMEERADARAREQSSGDVFARALRKIHEDALLPDVSGGAGVHPDLTERLAPSAEATSAPSALPSTRSARAIAALLVVALYALYFVPRDLTRIPADEVASVDPAATWWRLRVAPSDPLATLALGWQARRVEDLDRAEAFAREAWALGAPAPEYHELRAEILAARGDCAAAHEAFARALSERVVDPLEERLELGHFHLPPTLITACGDTDGEDD